MFAHYYGFAANPEDCSGVRQQLRQRHKENEDFYDAYVDCRQDSQTMIKDRRGMKSLLRAVRNGRFKRVYIDKFDDLNCCVSHAWYIIKTLHDKGVVLEVGDAGLCSDMDKTLDKLLLWYNKHLSDIFAVPVQTFQTLYTLGDWSQRVSMEPHAHLLEDPKRFKEITFPELIQRFSKGFELYRPEYDIWEHIDEHGVTCLKHIYDQSMQTFMDIFFDRDAPAQESPSAITPVVYENNWESLNSRPVPAWFADAKFGIFIHWGVYSVPSHAPRGEYAEWYGDEIRRPEHPNKDFHAQVYGPNVKYEDLAASFKAELFDAEQWADVIARSGAKYMNLVSKHHDGFCMYKSDYAWNWNSVDVGPHRDFCRELKDAVEARGVKFGVYHSVYEWFNPLYLKDPEEYAVRHLIPMLKELVVKYEPWTLFTDGEWDHPSSVWHSTDFLTWLYNESPVKDTIVPNDRWGKETRGRLGGNFTTEYGEVGFGAKLDDALDRPFEECRGIGRSFGLNRIETCEDYMSARELIRLLVDLVSKGGNLLLNIGPAADGTIPPIQQERLLEIGKWLDVNGEAIYASRPYVKSTQEGVYYTQKDGIVYAIVTSYPWRNVELKDLPWQENMRATLLGCNATVLVSEQDGHVLLRMLPINPEYVKSQYLYTFRIERG